MDELGDEPRRIHHAVLSDELDFVRSAEGVQSVGVQVTWVQAFLARYFALSQKVIRTRKSVDEGPVERVGTVELEFPDPLFPRDAGLQFYEVFPRSLSVVFFDVLQWAGSRIDERARQLKSESDEDWREPHSECAR